MSDFIPVHMAMTNRLLRDECAGSRELVTPAWNVEDPDELLYFVEEPFADGIAKGFSLALHHDAASVIAKPEDVRIETAVDTTAEVGPNAIGLRGLFAYYPSEHIYSDVISAKYLSACDEASVVFAGEKRRLLGELDVKCHYRTWKEGGDGTTSGHRGAIFLVTEASNGRSLQDVQIALDPLHRLPEDEQTFRSQGLNLPGYNTPDMPYDLFAQIQQTDSDGILTSEATSNLSDLVSVVIQKSDEDRE